MYQKRINIQSVSKKIVISNFSNIGMAYFYHLISTDIALFPQNLKSQMWPFTVKPLEYGLHF